MDRYDMRGECRTLGCLWPLIMGQDVEKGLEALELCLVI